MEHWATLPVWSHWGVSTLTWIAFGLLSLGAPISWMFFALALVWGALTIRAYLRRKKSAPKTTKVAS